MSVTISWNLRPCAEPQTPPPRSLHMTIHPVLPILSLQTSTENARVLLYPFHSAQRLATIHTTASQSEFTTARHCWTPDGGAVLVNSDDGVLRLVDVHENVLARVGAHGQAAPFDEDDGEQSRRQQEEESIVVRTERARLRRERDKGSSVIKDVVCFEIHEKLAFSSCGFDKTVKLVV